MADRYSCVPPGQQVTNEFPVLHIGEVPSFDPASWLFFVEGDVQNPLKLGWADFLQLPRRKQVSDFHCVTGWSRLGDEWEGVPARTLVEKACPRPEARQALIVAEGDYTTNLPLAELAADDVLLALRFNGRALGPEHGGPVRLLVPRKYAYKSAKWVRGFRLLCCEELGFWEKRGYSHTADPWTEDRYAR